MKKILLVISFWSLVFSGCGSAPQLTKAFCDQEQLRFDAYYDFRASGASFGQTFYNQTDSVYTVLPASNQKLISAYTFVKSIRSGDSTDKWTSSFYKHAKDLIDADFAIAKGVAQ